MLAAADDRRLTAVVLSLLTAVEQVSEAFRRTSTCETVNSQNAFGDEQLNVDILSNTLIFEHLASTKLVATASSEETPQETPLGGEGFSVAFDPLDGSSIVASNFTVGTIAGVWAGDKLVGQKSRNLKAVVGVWRLAHPFSIPDASSLFASPLFVSYRVGGFDVLDSLPPTVYAASSSSGSLRASYKRVVGV